MELLRVQDLGFAYAGQAPLFDGVCAVLRPGQLWLIRGPSGSGKSTLCRCLAGLMQGGELRGEVFLRGDAVRTLRRAEVAQRLGFLFQDSLRQFVSASLESSLAFAPENLCLPREEIGARLGGALALSGLAARRGDSPDAFSGGQQRLAAFGCVRTLGTGLLVLDEPTAALDEAARALLLQRIAELRAQGCAFVVAAHDAAFVPLADCVTVLGGAADVD